MLISIIIRNYNSAGKLKFAIETALSQTHRDKEILVYDDKSTDGSEKLVEGYSVRFIQGEKNKGCAEAFNILLDNLKGEYFIPLDADDMFYSDKVVKTLAENIGDNDFIYGDLMLFREGEMIGQWLYPEYSIEEIPHLIYQRKGSGIIPFNHGLHRTEFWRKNNLRMELEVGEDTLACIKACEYNIKMIHIPGFIKLYNYGNGISVSAKREENLAKIIEYLEKTLDNKVNIN